jgi:hypothetical protein
MKTINLLTLFTLLSLQSIAQTDSLRKESYRMKYKLNIEPGVGIKPGPTSPTPGIIISNLIEWNLTNRLSLLSHTSYTMNNPFLTDFNFITTNYSYALSQKFGIGTSFYTKHSIHSISFMAGVQYDAFKETLNNPEFDQVSVSSSTISPDFGLMYHVKIGMKKYFFSYRMYLPLYPYPFKSTDINSIDGNISNTFFEVGVGIRFLKHN